MGFKKSFKKNDEAVSPVIGVILMVAITVILAAAIGSSVFSHGTAQSAPQANFNIQAIYSNASPSVPSIKIEHIGGDPVHFEDDSVTKVMASVNGGTAVQIKSAGATPLGTIGVGDVKTLELIRKDTSVVLKDESVTPIDDIGVGDTVNIKFIDVQTNQIICDKNIMF